MQPTLTLSSLPALLGICYLVAVAWPLAIIDVRQHRLPNLLVLPALPITLIGQLASLALGEPVLRLGLAAIVAVVTFGLGLLANRFAGLGMGDVKLFTAMALALGWWGPQPLVLALLVAVASASAVVLWLLLVGKTKIGSSIALGPYLLLGLLGATAGVVTVPGWS